MSKSGSSISDVAIIGAGQGGFQAASSLRQAGFAGRIRLFGEELGLPYQRPPLSKDYMAHGDADRLTLRPASFLDQQRIEFFPGLRVEEIDRSGRRLATCDGAFHAWDHLILATGSSNWRPPISGVDLPGLLELRTLSDARRLREALSPGLHAVVIGGGFIGLEFAAMARAAGLEATVAEASTRVMSRAVSPAVSAWFEASHRANGVRLELGVSVSEILAGASGRAEGVVLSDGRFLRGDLILLAAGVRPRVELAASSGLALENGIRLDAHLLTSDSAISALGDCASYPDPRTGRQVRLESVQAATDHARTIAARLTGKPEPYSALPWFWSNQGAGKLQIAGFDDRAVLSSSDVFVLEGGDGLQAYRFRDGALAALETINAPGAHMAARKLLSRAEPVSRSALEASDWDVLRLARGV